MRRSLPFRLPRPLLGTLAALLTFLVAASPGLLRAETIRFPKDDPAFAITLPEGWKTSVDPKDNSLSSQPAPDRACTVTVREMEGVDDLAGAKALLPKFIAGLARSAGLRDVKPSQEPVDAKSPKGVPMILAEFRGATEAGVKMVLTTVVFQPGEDADVFILTSVASEEEDKKLEKEGGAIIESITPV